MRRAARGGQKIGLKTSRPRRNLARMMTLTTTPANQKKTAELQAMLERVLEESLRRGFHGTVGVKLSVQDGTIQTIRGKVERIER